MQQHLKGSAVLSYDTLACRNVTSCLISVLQRLGHCTWPSTSLSQSRLVDSPAQRCPSADTCIAQPNLTQLSSSTAEQTQQIASTIASTRQPDVCA